MPGVLRRSCVWLFSVAVVVGCSGVYTAASSDGGLADAAPQVDAGKDGPFSTEASTDASPDSAPPRVTPCSSAHLFCDDFDDAGPDLAMRWDERSANAGTLVRSTVSVSAPYALGVEVGTVLEEGDTSITKRVNLPEGNVRIDFDLRFTRPTTFTADSVIVPFSVECFPTVPGGLGQQFQITFAPSGAQLEYYSGFPDGGFDSRRTPLAFAESGFRHLTMEITTSGGQVTSRVGVGTDGPVSISYAGARPNQLKISAGAYGYKVAGGSVVIDNVVVDSF
jgi:hypothetical protein